MFSERALFVLVLRIFGLYLLAEAITQLPFLFVGDLRNLIRNEEMNETWTTLPADLLPYLFVAWTGACLLLRGRRLADYICPARAALLCACGYNLLGNTSPCCPECGQAISGRLPSSPPRQDCLPDNPDGPARWIPNLLPILIATLLCLILLKDLADRFHDQSAGCGC